MATLAEGDIGYAKPAEVMEYPSVTSCLTVTCVERDGGKWGAHISIFPLGDKGRPFKTILLDLRSEMSTGKAIDKVTKVVVVGAFGCWQPNLNPITGYGQTTLDGGLQETSKLLKQKLGLQKLDPTSIGTLPDSQNHFVFVESDEGDVKLSSGHASRMIKPIQFKVQA